ncbi:Predicted endonuclease, GIY-YIG superfamily [Pricia antarctica]|uniref:Predicted endonuclease, GIY-YIG superfamily n=1 Tax=Pricia antarctica TaxID=641691 RepID=A0A1G7DQC1_9FLAO|nr:GIY-YIG nuclease family protein [Pricia antarctica]SDE53642.1 Predicted endonuclease, GIY-YIG superfamily [Pricia antarctica]
MAKGCTYILECSNGSYYSGSTKNLEKRLQQHQNGEGANHTKKRLPVKLVYVEEFSRIDEAFYREKQIQGWNRKKKEALINGEHNKLPELSLAYRDIVASGASGTSTAPEASEKHLNTGASRTSAPENLSSTGTSRILRQAQCDTQAPEEPNSKG